MPDWNPDERCNPICWVRKDGGWALAIFELWQVVRDHREFTGKHHYDVHRLMAVAGVFGGEKHRAVVMSEDLAEVMGALKVVDNLMNTPEEALSLGGDDE